MKPSFYPYEEKDYQQVCDFLIELNQQKTHINWNWARWEWMYSHPYFERSKKDTIGIWKADGVIVGAAIYDLFYGEAFCGTLEDYKALLPEILEYARKTLGKAVVLETLKHCAALGAKEAFVISDQEFYKKIGFEEYSNFSFYWSEVSDDPQEHTAGTNLS